MRVSLTGENIAPMIAAAGATLRPHSTPGTLALALGFYEAFLVNHPLAMDAKAKLLARLDSKQKRALHRMREALEEVSRIFSSNDTHEQVAGRRWLHSLDKMREVDGHTFIPVRDMGKHLASLARAATEALANPDAFLERYILLGVPDRRRVVEELGADKIAEMVDDARYILTREPASRALMLIGRAIEEHVEESLLGTVDVETGLPRGAALALGIAIAMAWGIDPAPNEDALRSTWRRLPERVAGLLAKRTPKRRQ
jgi:hypothetical protein